MNAMTGSLAVTATPTRVKVQKAYAYTAREMDGYFRHTSQSEAIIRFIGIVLILGAFIQWLVPENADGFPSLMTKTGLAVAFSLIGIAIYTSAMRGSRHELRLDPSRRDLTLARLDRRDNVRSSKSFPLTQIKSIYVKKPEVPGAPARMQLRLINSSNEITAIRGPYQEVEMMHRTLCRHIHILQNK